MVKIHKQQTILIIYINSNLDMLYTSFEEYCYLSSAVLKSNVYIGRIHFTSFPHGIFLEECLFCRVEYYKDLQQVFWGSVLQKTADKTIWLFIISGKNLHCIRILLSLWRRKTGKWYFPWSLLCIQAV